MLFFSTSRNLEIADIPFISHTDKPTRREALEYYRRIVESYRLRINYYEAAMEVTKSNELFDVRSSKKSYFSKNLIVATGFYDKPRMLNVPGEELAKVKHYYDEAHPYVDQKILVVGAANSACDVALETWQKGAQVTMAVRAHELYSKVKYWILPNIENRIEEGSIRAYFNTEITEIREKEVELMTPKGKVTIENDFVLAMTGYLPDYALLKKLLVPIGSDEFLTPEFDPVSLESTVKGLFVAGVINSGMQTSQLFIENTRKHGAQIINSILRDIQ